MLLILPLLLCAQQPEALYDPEARFALAMELYDKEKFAAAQEEFEQVRDDIHDPYRELSIDAEFYAARCATALYHKDARERLVRFVHDHPESQWVRLAYYELANYYYGRKRYKEALEWFAQVEERKLGLEELYDFYFRRGYSHFKQDEFSAARNDFSKLLDVENRYQAPATYYHAHLSYEDGNYETALAGFEKLKDHPAFEGVVPYYITQIYFIQKRFDQVVAYGPGVLDSVKVKKEYEVSRLVGESFYNLGQYEEAIPYLERFREGPAPKERQDHYQLGYAYYKVGRCEEAIRVFNLVTNIEDELTQVATYHIGECYLRSEEKAYARNAFKESAKYDFDRELQEDALFSYAKLAYELSADPFNEAIRAFELYLEEYPSSARRDEAYEFLLDVYLTTKNYAAALDALDKIENKDLKAQTAYQLSAYNRGVELFLNRRYRDADQMFDKVSTYPIDFDLVAGARFWKAEVLYQEGNYDAAIIAYRDFQATPGSSGSPFFREAYYSAGYGYFMQKEYSNALSTLRSFVDAPGADPKKKNDALLRMGDCAFVAKSYDQAIGYYRQAADIGVLDGDYALFQVARSQGFQNKPSAKVGTLEQLLSSYPQSSYLVSAKYQLGDAYFKQDNDAKALEVFRDIIGSHQGSPYVKKSLLNSGLIHYRMKDYEAAIASFKRVVEDYPSDEDSQEAQLRIQDVYVELGRMDEFNAWYEQHVPSGSVAQQDSVNYRFAENLYVAGNCEEAVDAFADYIARFQPGIFGVNASYYLGECLYQEGEKEIAYNNYLYVIEQAINDFTEPALFAAATIAYEDQRYQDAVQHYVALERTAIFDENILEARIGQMRCHFNLGNKEETLEYSEVVIADDNTPPDILREAHFFKAKTYLFQGEQDQAFVEFSWVDKNSTGAKGAESKFNMARIQFEQEKLDLAEQSIFELINDYPAEAFWKIKAFLLLSDVYVVKEDYFQAKATLQSILDNVDDEDVQREAMEKYQSILDIEAGKSAGVDAEMEIDMGEEEGDGELEDEQLDTEEE